MYRWQVGMFLGFMLVGLARINDGIARERPSTRWLTDYQQARAEARRLDRPLLVVFR